jgi:hypothetical protein
MESSTVNTKILFLAAFAFLTVSSAQAGFVDNGTYTKDTGSGLDWLDWSSTLGLTGSEALDSNDGWRYATADEASDLMANFFPVFDGITDTSLELDLSYQDKFNDLLSLFGQTGIVTGGAKTVYAQLAEGGVIGARESLDGRGFLAFDLRLPDTYDATEANDIMGIALVRSPVTVEVTEPATLGLLGLGLAGLGLSRRRRIS